MNETTDSPLLVCIDLEAGSERLTAWAAAMARRCRQRVRVLYVSPVERAGEQRRETEQRLHRIIDRPFAGVELEALEVRHGLAEEIIVETAHRCAAAMILLGRRQRTAVERIYVGSTTSAVISQASRPVLVVPVVVQQ